jgi:hypothetical protein
MSFCDDSSLLFATNCATNLVVETTACTTAIWYTSRCIGWQWLYICTKRTRGIYQSNVVYTTTDINHTTWQSQQKQAYRLQLSRAVGWQIDAIDIYKRTFNYKQTQNNQTPVYDTRWPVHWVVLFFVVVGVIDIHVYIPHKLVLCISYKHTAHQTMRVLHALR